MPKPTTTSDPAPHKSSKFPFFLLGAGVLLGFASGVLALFREMGSLPVLLGAGAAIAAIVLTFTIARQQNTDTEKLRELSETSKQLLIKVVEQTADKVYSPTAHEEDSSAKPSYESEAINALREAGANLNFGSLRWRRKVPLQPMQGNHGWFVESNSVESGERWFVRKANGITVRKAMPREFLNALRDKAPLDPRDIKHDFQLTDHGLAAWYARTYSDVLWKVSKSNRNASAGINVTREDSDS